ncbi:MAG: GreA/GreB family elongation factor [Dehalococcoidales bacterium]|nr:GreA/GreB family elongation factor [Dehalococcoidales bacterium]
MNKSDQIPSLGEATTLYLGRLSTKDRDASQPEIYRFARWYGWDSLFSTLAGPAVASYSDQLNVSDIDYEKKVAALRTFLAYAKKAGWSATNLATHLKTKKGKAASTAANARNLPEVANLTQQRYDEMTEELKNLKKRSGELVEEMQRAAADKDFRENAPLQYAKEERGHVEGRIKELEQTLKSATILKGNKEPTKKSGLGDSILVCDLATGEECLYIIVDPREVNPNKGKISLVSPLGKALLGHCDGDTVEINVPAGILRYQIKRIER